MGAGGAKGDSAAVCHTQLSTAGEMERSETNREGLRRMEVKAKMFK